MLAAGYDALVQLLQEFEALVRKVWTLWRRFLPQVGTWLILGWLIYTTCLLTSATLGNSYGVLGAIIFVVGITANVVSVIFAILSLKPGLRTTQRLAESARNSPAVEGIPAAVFAPEKKLDVAILAVGPVLGVYAAWAIIDGMVSDGLLFNAVTRSLWDTGEFSIGRRLSDLPSYFILGATAVILKVAYGRIVAGRRSPWWKVPLVFLEGLWVFATFFIVLLGLKGLNNWLVERAFWRESLHAWHRFLEWLPDLQLFGGLTLPDALQRVSIWITEEFIPGLWQGIALPLVWLAVVAIVFGWRDFRARDLFTPQLRQRADSLETSESATRPLLHVLGLITSDLHDKWVPLLHAFRLIWRSGPFVLGAYLVLSALLDAGSWAFEALLWRLFASSTTLQVLRSFTSNDLIHHVVMTSLALCLYAAAFDRGLATAAGLTDDVAGAPHPESVKVL